MRDLSQAYIRHANTVLPAGQQINLDLTSILNQSGLLGTGLMEPVDVAAPTEPMADLPKKRKKREHDPNAPKRALTPYFLYMQSARGQIAKELGDHAKPKEVADEGTRRWSEMKPEEKAVRS